MANWLRNGPCTACGSRDNRAVYDDGSEWCWGCHDYSSKTKIPSMEVKKDSGHKPLPDDTCNEYGPDSIAWFCSYGFTVEQMIRRNVKYSASRNQTIFTFPDTDLWQARNHWPQSKVKYFTSGNHDDILPIYRHGSGRFKSAQLPQKVVLTEDCLSAIKCASLTGQKGVWCDSMPLLGTHLPTQKLIALKRLYSDVVVWLDHDKGKEAQKIADRCKLVGLNARCVSTELDPKELENDEILQSIYTKEGETDADSADQEPL